MSTRIIIGISISLMTLLGFVTDLRAQDACSLVVQVVDVNGHPVPARVTVEERDGRKIEKASPIPDDIEFCDLGFFPVTVTVTREHPVCSRVIVENVLLTWGETRTLKVMHDRESCIHKDLFRVPPGCSVMIRFVDQEHRYLRGVSLAIRVPRQETRQADSYGRVLTGVNLGQDLVGTATAEGYDPANVNALCNSPKDFEQYVVMNESR